MKTLRNRIPIAIDVDIRRTQSTASGTTYAVIEARITSRDDNVVTFLWESPFTGLHLYVQADFLRGSPSDWYAGSLSWRSNNLELDEAKTAVAALSHCRRYKALASREAIQASPSDAIVALARATGAEVLVLNGHPTSMADQGIARAETRKVIELVLAA